MPVKIISNPTSDSLNGARDWAVITGTRFIEKPYKFLYKDHTRPDGVVYRGFHIGASYPTHERDGCVVIFGVCDNYALRLMECTPCRSVFDVFDTILRLRKAYGFGLISEHLTVVIGEPDRYDTLCARFSIELEKETEGTGIYFQPPAGLNKPHSFSMYLTHLRQSLSAGRVDINQIPLAVDELRVINNEISQKGKYQEYPVQGLLGGMIHTILYEGREKEVLLPGEDNAVNMDILTELEVA